MYDHPLYEKTFRKIKFHFYLRNFISFSFIKEPRTIPNPCIIFSFKHTYTIIIRIINSPIIIFNFTMKVCKNFSITCFQSKNFFIFKIGNVEEIIFVPATYLPSGVYKPSVYYCRVILTKHKYQYPKMLNHF